MKFHAMSLCLAGTLVASSAMAAGSNRAVTRTKARPKAASVSRTQPVRATPSRVAAAKSKGYIVLAQADTTAPLPVSYEGDKMVHTRERSFYRAGTFYPEQYMYLREVLYPNMQTEEEVARKVTHIIESQQKEIVHLTSMAPAAQAAGWTNVATVYEHMAQDHRRIADFGSQWLADRGFDVPVMPAATTATFESADASVDHVMDMHMEAFNKSIEMRQGETSSTVRGMLLWAATGTARHLSLLRTLDRDVEFGRQTVSARLNSMMMGPLTASEQTAMIDRIMTEETEYFRSKDTTIATTETPQTIAEHVVEVERIVEKPVEVERIVEKPVVVEKIVEKPVYVERVVEKRVYIDRPVRSNVAGRRQTIRRPAK